MLVCKGKPLDFVAVVLATRQALGSDQVSADGLERRVKTNVLNLKDFFRPFLIPQRQMPSAFPLRCISIGCGMFCEELPLLSQLLPNRPFTYDGIEIEPQSWQIASQLYANIEGVRILHQDAADIFANPAIQPHSYDLIIWRHPPYLSSFNGSGIDPLQIPEQMRQQICPGMAPIIRIIRKVIPRLARKSGANLIATCYMTEERNDLLRFLASPLINICEEKTRELTTGFPEKILVTADEERVVLSDRFVYSACIQPVPHALLMHVVEEWLARPENRQHRQYLFPAMQSGNYNAALRMLCKIGCLELIKIFLLFKAELGIDVDAKNSQTSSAMDYATSHPQCFCYLMAHSRDYVVE